MGRVLKGALQVDNKILVLAQKIIDMLKQEGASGMEQWHALSIAHRLVDTKQSPNAASSASHSASEDSDWPSELEAP